MATTTPMTLLKQDHQKVKDLLAEIANTTERAVSKRTALRDQIWREISVHTTLEEKIFYPAFREAAHKRESEKLYFEALEEHHAADMVLADLMKADPSTVSFAAKAKVLRELIEHHAKEEEEDMFPLAKKLIPAEELEAIKQRMEERKPELMKKFDRSAKRDSRVSP